MNAAKRFQMRDSYLRLAGRFKENGDTNNRRFYVGYARAHHRLAMAALAAAKVQP